MKRSWLGLLVGALIGLQGVSAVAQEGQPAPLIQNPKSALRHSEGVEEILRLVNAGVSQEVVKAYIEQSPHRFDISAADIVALKEQAVPDEVTVALVKRWAAQNQKSLENAAPGPQGDARAMTPNPRQSFLDPEGYDFWWYHYAYPRALAAANERLLSSYSGYAGFLPYPPYPYGFYQYAPFLVRAPAWGRRFHHER